MLPQFFLIGAQKSASSFLHKCLQDHPEIYMPNDETPFFEDPYYELNATDYFKSLFTDEGGKPLVGIKRPDYLSKEEVPLRIKQLVPNAKLLVVLRNPVDRAISAYYWYLKQGYIPCLPISLGLQHILDGNYLSNYPKSQEIIEYGCYWRHIRRYLQYFDHRQIKVVLHEDFSTDLLGTIKVFYEYLDVDETYVPRSITRRPKKTTYSLTRLRWLKARNSYIHSYHYYGDNLVTLTPKRGVFPTIVKGSFYLIDRFLLAPIFPTSRPSLSDKLRNQLCQIYWNDILGIESFLGRDFTNWKRAIQVK